MDDEIIVYQKDNKSPGTEIIHFSGKGVAEPYIKSNLQLANKKYIIMTNRDYPQHNHDFHKAFEIIDSKIQVNIPAARDIIREKLRPLRDAKFAPLDIAFMRAVERGDTQKQQEIAAQKQKLRDITEHPLINGATTVEELRDITLDKLLAQ